MRLRQFISYFVPAALVVAVHYSFTNNPLWQLVLIGLSCGLLIASDRSRINASSSHARVIAGLLLFLAFYILDSIYLIASVFTANGFTEQTLAHLNIQSLKSGGNKELLPYHYAIAAIAVVLCTAWILNKRGTPRPKPVRQHFLLIAILALLIHPGTIDLAGHWWHSVKKSNVDASLLEMLENSHVDDRLIKNTVKQRRGTPKKSIVLIYLESLERAYLDQDIFPELAQNLTTLDAQESTYGSFKPAFFASHTIAGLVSSLCSVPYAATGGSSGNSMNSGAGDYFMPHIQCLSDITAGLGYYNVFYQGGSLDFTRKGAFFRAHGFDEVKGRDELWKDAPRKKKNNWGLHDDVVFNFAKQRIEQLAQNSSKQPFLFTLLTLDTHDPFGRNKKSSSCFRLGVASYKGARDHQIQDQVHCSDRLIGDFVQSLKDQYSDTIDIYLVADHLAHAHSQGEKLKELSQRELIFIGVNNRQTHKGDRVFTHLDIAPTILDQASGGFLRKMGLGVSLLRPKKTLLEKLGAEAFNTKIRDNLAALAQRYWNYPSLESSPFVFDQASLEFKFAGTSFPSPVLFKLDGNNEIISYHSYEIGDYLKTLSDIGRIVSVQKCGDLTKYQKHTHPASSFCLMIGNLGAESLYLEPIKPGQEYLLSRFSEYLELESSNSRLRSRLFENSPHPSNRISSAPSRHITPLIEAQFVTGAASTSRMVTNYRNLSLFEKFRGFENHNAAQQDGLHLFSIHAGRVVLIHVWRSCEELKRSDIKALMQGALTTEFVLMSGQNGFECQSHRSGTQFDQQISNMKRGQSLIAYLNLETDFYKHIVDEGGRTIQLNLIDDKIYSRYVD